MLIAPELFLASIPAPARLLEGETRSGSCQHGARRESARGLRGIWKRGGAWSGARGVGAEGRSQEPLSPSPAGLAGALSFRTDQALAVWGSWLRSGKLGSWVRWRWGETSGLILLFFVKS